MSNYFLIQGDCRDVAPQLANSRGKFDFIFADPPFNIGQKYPGYTDCLEWSEYEQFTREWIAACWKSLDGVLCLHGPDGLAETYLHVARELKMRRIAWVNWHYRFGECRRSNWIDARCHCLIFTNREEPIWNPDDVLVTSDRVKYGDKRVNDSPRGGKRLPGTVWGIPSDGPGWGRVTGNSRERVPECPNQLPEKYLRRLLLAYTTKHSVVLDPFCGSGTTLAVCRKLKRSCFTIDVCERNLELAAQRAGMTLEVRQ